MQMSTSGRSAGSGSYPTGATSSGLVTTEACIAWCSGWNQVTSARAITGTATNVTVGAATYASSRSHRTSRTYGPVVLMAASRLLVSIVVSSAMVNDGSYSTTWITSVTTVASTIPRKKQTKQQSNGA